VRVFLDADVLFSASQPGSAFARLVAAANRRARVLTSDVACAEARRNLTLERPAWLETFEALLEEFEVVPSAVFPLPVPLDGKDVPLLCAAVRARSDYFVTGDRRDFGHLFGTRVHGALVITPLWLAEVLAGRAETEEEGQP
jgi:predicted nucleic acid-binding protein